MSTSTLTYPFDPTGKASTNLVKGERQTLAAPSMLDFFYVVPKAGPYFRDSLIVTLYPSGKILKEGVDYTCTHNFSAATHSIGLGIYGSITFYDHTLTGTVSLQYQTVGGDWTIDEAKIVEILANYTIDPRITTWEQINDVPYQFPPIAHEYSIDDWYGASDIVDVLKTIHDAIAASSGNALAQHVGDRNNPHQVTKEQVGLSLVSNYAPATSQEALDGTSNTAYMTPLRTRQAIVSVAGSYTDQHANRVDNPHNVTKAQVGLGSVENLPLASQPEAELGASNARYMTALRVKQAVTAQVGNTLNTFMARTDNPHQTTKGQVGLGNVENLRLATQAEAVDGKSNALYMTPLTTYQAISDLVGVTLSDHVNSFNNPHQVSAAQVGLGNVRNLGTATQAQAERADSNDVYMTPLMTRYAVAKLADASVGAHATQTDNPHNVTKAQVGLGLVDNFATAAEADARNGVANNLFMTPLRTKQAIDEFSLTFTTHIADKNNPHQTTAAQVGAYSRTETDALLLKKLNSDTAAGDTKLAYGFDLAGLKAEILGGKAADSKLLDGFTRAQLTTETLKGQAADSKGLEGKSLSEVLSMAASGSSNSSAGQNFLPEVSDDIPGGVAYSKFGYIKLADIIEQSGANRWDLNFMVSGGCLLDVPEGCTQMAYAVLMTDTSNNFDRANSSFEVQTLYGSGGPNLWITTGKAPDDGAACVFLWTEDRLNRQEITITDLTSNSIHWIKIEKISDSTKYVTSLDSTKLQFTSVGATAMEEEVGDALTQMSAAFAAATATLAAS